MPSRRDLVTGTQHMDGNSLDLRFFGGFAHNFFDGDDRHDNLLQHRAAVDEACSPDEVKPIG